MLSVCYTKNYLIETEGNGSKINDGDNEAGSNYNDDNEAEYGDYAKKKGRYIGRHSEKTSLVKLHF